MQTDNTIYIVEEGRNLEELKERITSRQKEGWNTLDTSPRLIPTCSRGMNFAQTLFRDFASLSFKRSI
jgi:hypothetical protein